MTEQTFEDRIREIIESCNRNEISADHTIDRIVEIHEEMAADQAAAEFWGL